MPPRLLNRRGGSQRWILVPFVLTMLVLLVDASMHARSDQPAITLSTDVWLDRAIPQITLSSAQGLEIAQISSAALTEGSRSTEAALGKVASSAGSTYGNMAAQHPPAKLGPAAGLLQACLWARSQGAHNMAAAVEDLVSGGRPATRRAVRLMASAVADFQVSDSAYRLFAQQMPKLGLHMPPSTWAMSSAHYGPKAYEAFAARVLGSTAVVAEHELAIDSVSTDPPALSMDGRIQVLSPSSTLAVTVVVADTGRSAEGDVTVTAAIRPASNAPEQKVSTSVDLPEGGSQAVTLQGLDVAASTKTVLIVTATPADRHSATVSRSLTIEVAGNNFQGAATTTTAVTAATTTAAGATTTLSQPTTTAVAPATTVASATTVAATTTTVTG